MCHQIMKKYIWICETMSEAVFSSSNPLVGRLRILGFVVETNVCGARLGRRRTMLFLTTFLSHFRKRRCGFYTKFGFDSVFSYGGWNPCMKPY